MPMLLAAAAPTVGGERDALVAGLVFFTAVPLTLAFLHLLLFLHERRARIDLEFALFAAAIAGAAFIDFQESLAGFAAGSLLDRLSDLPAAFAGWTMARFVYTLCYGRLPRRHRLLVAAVAVLLVLLLVDRRLAEPFATLILLAVVVDSFRVFGTTFRRLGGELALPAVGMAAFGAFATGDVLLDLGLLHGTVAGTTNPYLLGGVILLVAMSVHLARSFAGRGRELERQLARVTELSERTLAQERAIRDEEVRRRVLEAEGERKDRELAEARALQLSMLPAELPPLPGWEIAAEMTTATEVGGDYYDVLVGGELPLVALGDAVGHGARAGTIVATVKGLFQASLGESDPAAVLARIDAALRRMRLARVNMALALAAPGEGRLTFAAAAMPPALVRRARDGSVEQLVTPRVPLGTLAVPFARRTLGVEPGDLVVLMTDGFVEMSAGDGPLGYDGAAALVAGLPAGSPAEVLAALRGTMRRHLGEAPPADDVTFLVLRYRAD